MFLLERKLSKKGIIMTEQATQEAMAEPTKSQMAVFGNVSIHNINFIPVKLLAIIEHIFTAMETDSGIFSLVMKNDGTPLSNGEPVMAVLFPDSMSTVFNLGFHWSEAFDLISTEDNKLSLRAMIWYNTIISVLHEIHHAKIILADKNPQEMVWTDKMESEATDFAIKRLVDLAKAFPVELPTNEEEPILGERFIEFRKQIEDVKEDEEDGKWCVFQRRLYDDNIVCSTRTEAGEIIDTFSFKEFLRMSCDTPEERDDPAWKAETSKIFTSKETLPMAVSEVVDETPATVETPANKAVVDMEVDVDYFDAEEPPPWLEDDFVSPGDAGVVAGKTTAAPTIAANTNVYSPQQAAASPTDYVNPVEAALNAGGGAIDPSPQSTGNSLPSQVPALTIDLAEILQIVKTVYMRIYIHVFTKCGFNPNAPASFDNPGAVYDPISIADIPNANKVFLAMDVTDELGKPLKDVAITDQIKGQVFSKSGLPGYWLWLNVNGFKVKRALVPQNPNKTKPDGSPTVMAGRVRQGYAAMWVIADGYGEADSEMKVKIETAPGGATTYTADPFKK